MKKIFCVLLLMHLVCHIFANPIDSACAKRIAQTFWLQNGFSTREYGNAPVLKKVTLPASLSNLYAFNDVDGSGFVIIAADDLARPILGYSENSTFEAWEIPSNVLHWLEFYQQSIETARDKAMKPEVSVSDEWNSLREGRLPAAKHTREVSALLQTQWGQGSPYNTACPTNTLVGCVAVAMGQVMKYWKYPEHGIGTYSYTYNGHTVSADFENTTYQWEEMPNTLTSANNAVATLLYHCGVGCHTEYGSSISSAYVITSPLHPVTAESALKDFFGYSISAQGRFRDDYGTSEWISMLKDELDSGRPLIYNGFNQQLSGGHCFVCDGYNNYNYFHFNWGQRGNYDGFFSIDAMTPISSQNFSYNQGAIFGLEPKIDDTGVENLCIADLIKIFPNPTSGTCKIVLPEGSPKKGQINIFRMTGELVRTQCLTTMSSDIDLTNYPSGLYLVEIRFDNHISIYQKIIKL